VETNPRNSRFSVTSPLEMQLDYGASMVARRRPFVNAIRTADSAGAKRPDWAEGVPDKGAGPVSPEMAETSRAPRGGCANTRPG
jgi:hypothetical protein